MKLTKLRLVLDLDIDPQGEPAIDLKSRLYRAMNACLNNGTFTGESAATVENYKFKVTVRRSKKSVPRRKPGEHLWHESNGVTKCVTCFCDEDDAHNGGQECTYGSK